MSADRPKLYTVKEYADLYRVHESTVYRWMEQGVVTVIRKGPRRGVRIIDDDLVMFITAQTTQGTV